MPTMSLLLPSPSLSYKFLKNPINFQKIHIKSTRFSTNASKSQFNSLSFTNSIGSPPSVNLSQWSIEKKHVHVLSVAACAVAVSTSWLFFSAIPTLLAFKRAAESLEKLLDVTARELPDTMAGIRLSGMEISYLTMELSNISQDITQGVRRSTRIVRLAEDRMRSLTTMAPTESVKAQATSSDMTKAPELAKAARNLREGILKGRSTLEVIFGVTQFSRWVMKFLSAHQQKRL